MGSGAKQPSTSSPLKSYSRSEFGSKLRTGGFRVTDSVRYVRQVKQAGGSCDTHSVHDVSKKEFITVENSEEVSAVISRLKNCTMVRRVKLARRRKFKARRFEKVRGVRAWRSSTPAVMTMLLAFVQCASVIADVPLCRKSSLHVRADLRARLSAALSKGEKERAFAKECGFSGCPLANDPEAMIRAYPALDQLDYNEKAVSSGLNLSLWRRWHAKHCQKCSPEKVHDKCYFKPLFHFLRSGFELPAKRGFDIFAARPSRVAYVDK